MQIIDGRAGAAHVSSQQVADSNMALFGSGDYVLGVGAQFKHEVVNNNLVRIADGALMIQGRRGAIDRGMVDEFVIENGTQNATRSDLIIARYQKDPLTLIESATAMVVKGTPGQGDPEINSGTDIRSGANIHDMPLYRIRLNGIAIVGVDTLFRRLLPNTVTRTSITVAAWNADKIATITDNNILSVDDLVYVAYDDTVSDASGQRKIQWNAAMVVPKSQEVGSVTLRALGTVPAMYIPVTVTIVHV